MKLMQSHKKSIAWFKLHHFIQRGEKEKAISICKLLIPSINDSAFAYKLEGDLFYAFHDRGIALEKYFLAAKLYTEKKRNDYALELCKHIEAESLNFNMSRDLASLYSDLEQLEEAERLLARCFEEAFVSNSFEKINDLLLTARDISPDLFKKFSQESIFRLIFNGADNKVVEKIIRNFIEKIVDDSLEIQRFASKLKSIDERYYDFVAQELNDF